VPFPVQTLELLKPAGYVPRSKAWHLHPLAHLSGLLPVFSSYPARYCRQPRAAPPTHQLAGQCVANAN
jgi:hypothetical protein